MSSLQKWILYSTLLAVFSSRFIVFVGGLSLFYFYFTTVINLLLLTAMGYSWFPQKLRYFLLYLFLSGLIGLLFGTNSPAGFGKSWLGISICAVYSAVFIRFAGFKALAIFEMFARFAFFAAILGLVMLLLPGSRGRLTSLFIEPSSFAMVCVPALYYYADQWQRNRRYGIRMLTLAVACILTLSSVGFIGMMFGMLLFGWRYRAGRVLVIPLIASAFLLAWSESSLFQARIADLFIGFGNQDINSINESSFGVVTNTFITVKQFAQHPLLGGGLGSYVVAHARFIESLPGARLLPENLVSLGQWDASSLMLRIVAELGLLGVFGAAWYLRHYFPHHGTAEERGVAMSLLCYVFMKFCRSGEYFGSEQFLFLSIYTVVGAKARMRSEMKKSMIPARKDTTKSALAHGPSTSRLPNLT